MKKKKWFLVSQARCLTRRQKCQPGLFSVGRFEQKKRKRNQIVFVSYSVVQTSKKQNKCFFWKLTYPTKHVRKKRLPFTKHTHVLRFGNNVEKFLMTKFLHLFSHLGIKIPHCCWKFLKPRSGGLFIIRSTEKKNYFFFASKPKKVELLCLGFARLRFVKNKSFFFFAVTSTIKKTSFFSRQNALCCQRKPVFFSQQIVLSILIILQKQTKKKAKFLKKKKKIVIIFAWEQQTSQTFDFLLFFLVGQQSFRVQMSEPGEKKRKSILTFFFLVIVVITTRKATWKQNKNGQVLLKL